MDAGMSLVEMLVAMMVTTVLLGAVGTIFIGALRTMNQVSGRSELLGSAQIGLLTMSERLRAADQTPPAAANPNIVLAATFNSLTFTAYQQDASNAAVLAAAINAVSPGDPNAAYLTATGMVPTRTTLAYQSGAAACGGNSGIVQTTIPARFNPSGSQVFAWDSTPTTRCILRSTTAPTAAAPLFTYYDGCSTSTTTTTLGAVISVLVTIDAGATGQSGVRLTNRVCLVNAGGTT